MGWTKHGTHSRKWDTLSMTLLDEEWILVSECATCRDPAYWEVYRPRPDELPDDVDWYTCANLARVEPYTPADLLGDETP